MTSSPEPSVPGDDRAWTDMGPERIVQRVVDALGIRASSASTAEAWSAAADVIREELERCLQRRWDEVRDRDRVDVAAVVSVAEQRLAASERRLRDRCEDVAELTRRHVERDHELHELTARLQASETEMAILRECVLALWSEADARAEVIVEVSSSGCAKPSVSVDSSDVDAVVDIVRGSHLFSAPWYLRQYPDVAAAEFDPALHYVLHGAGEGRDPGPAFSTTSYLRRYPDVTARADNPLAHYETTGRSEGRSFAPGEKR